MTTPKLLRSTVLLSGALLLGLALLAGPVHAETGTTTVDIKVSTGNKAEVVGTATFTRSINADGTETLTIDLSVPGGIDESHVCLSGEPFTSRVAAGSCAYAQGSTGTTARYVIPLGTTYVGDPLYAQVHVVTGDNTAFAGWQDGNPFYGNVRIEAVIGTNPVPAVNLIGGVTLTLLLSVGLAIGLVRRRSTGRVTA